MRILASINLSETDRKALIILLILLVLLLLLIGLFGMAVRGTMKHQAKHADTMMHDVTVTHVVDSPKKFRKFGIKKNNRTLFRASMKPFLIALIGVVIWIIHCLAIGKWSVNPWETTGELFFRFKLDNSLYPADDPLWVRVFGIQLLARWPELVEGYPRFELAHLPYYLECAFWVLAIGWYAYVCQAYISRHACILRRSQEVFEKSLEGYKANQSSLDS